MGLNLADQPARNGDHMTGESSRTMSASALDRRTDGADVRSGLPDGRRTAGGWVRWCGIGALVAIAGTVVIFAALHLLPPTDRISPVTRTISEYALTSSAWAFNLGVLLLVAASVAVFSGLVVLGRVRMVGAATIFGALWAVGLLTLVSFPKHNWALGTVSTSGQVHRMASLVAFLALPVAVISIARRRGRENDPAAARWAFWLGVLALAWFSPLLYAVLSAPMTGTPWWQAIPLGLVERGLALTEVLAVVALAVLLTTSPRRQAQVGPGAPLRSGAQLRSGAPTPER
jgi:hypothetical protein